MITRVQVAPNNGEDTQLLDGALPDLEERTGDPVHGWGDGSPEMADTLAEKQVEQIQTAIRGRKPSAEKLHLSEFEIRQTDPNHLPSGAKRESAIQQSEEEFCRPF